MSVRVEEKNLSRGSPFVITRLDQGPVKFEKKASGSSKLGKFDAVLKNWTAILNRLKSIKEI